MKNDPSSPPSVHDRTLVVSVRFSAAERERAVRGAERAGVPLATFLRIAALREADTRPGRDR